MDYKDEAQVQKDRRKEDLLKHFSSQTILEQFYWNLNDTDLRVWEKVDCEFISN